MRPKGTAINRGRHEADIDAPALRVAAYVVVTTGLILAETDEVAFRYALLVIPLIQL